MNAGENSVTERDVIRELVQFTIDRELTSIPARVRHERQPIVGRDQRIWDDEIAIEEEFQGGNASAGDCAVPGGVSWMSGRTFGEGLRKEIISIFIEATLHRLRVENVVIHVTVECATEAAQNLADNRAAGLGTMPQVNPPFLIPDAVQRMAGGGREGGRKIRSTEVPKPFCF